MGLYLILGTVLAILAFLVWFAIRERKAGAVTEQAKVATATVEAQQRMDKAGAEAPRTEDAAAQAMNEGRF